MNINFLIGAIIIIYVLDIFALIWLSGKFVGIQPFPITDIGLLGLLIILFSWLAGSAFYFVPLDLKFYVVVFAALMIIIIFVLFLNTYILKAVAAGLFFIVCQLLIIILLFRGFLKTDLINVVRYILFQNQ